MYRAQTPDQDLAMQVNGQKAYSKYLGLLKLISQRILVRKPSK